MTPATERKRQQLARFVRLKMESHASVKGVVAVGSLGTGAANDESDIDAVVFLHPFDLYVVPAEAIWREEDDTFHSIFTDDAAIQQNGLQVDFNRLDLSIWGDPSYEWPEPMKAELASGWIAFDPTGQIERLIRERTLYDDNTRLSRLDESIVWLDQLVEKGEPERVWTTLGPLVAFDRLNAAYEYLVQMWFAYNRKWRTWKTREMTTLLQLPWHPRSLKERIGAALCSSPQDYLIYCNRAVAIRTLFLETVAQLVDDDTYGDRPVAKAFVRTHNEPGRAWNMKEWNEKHRELHRSAHD